MARPRPGAFTEGARPSQDRTPTNIPPKESTVKSTPIVALVVVAGLAGPAMAQPSMEDVVRAPGDYAGQKLQFNGVTLSGNVTKYDTGGVRKYYLTLQSRQRTFEVGFFLAPPGLADKLAQNLDPRTTYTVNLTCKVEQITLNCLPQWHGIVSQIDLLDGNGNVTQTIKAGK